MTYRDDGDAAKLRRDAVAAELGDVRRRIVRLPVLDRISIATPCPTRWTEMAGDDRVRFCSRCEQNVYDLSAMTAAEVEALIAQHLGNLCARFYRRPDGRVATSDCEQAGRGRRRRVAVRAVAAVAIAGGLAGGAAATGGAFAPGEEPVPAAYGDALRVLVPPAAPEPELDPQEEDDDGSHLLLGMISLDPDPDLEPEPPLP